MLTTEEFCRLLPKIEIHAHLNGSLTQETIAELIALQDPVARLSLEQEWQEWKKAKQLGHILNFFSLFSFVYKLSKTPAAIALMTRRVVELFHSDGCVYLELRSTPKHIPDTGVTKRDYVLAMMKGIGEAGLQQQMPTRLILSIDRRHSLEANMETIRLAHEFRFGSDPDNCVVGVDLCGDCSAGDFQVSMKPALLHAQHLGLKVTCHIAEIPNVESETQLILDTKPDRLGHATFFTPSHLAQVLDRAIPIEICMTSNILCKTVADYNAHHLADYLAQPSFPLALCTDDWGVFGSSLSDEYWIASRAFSLSHRGLFETAKRGIGCIFDATQTDRLHQIFSAFESRHRLGSQPPSPPTAGGE
ncbi:hypothetical protein HDV03_005122 [Kappamyces sp. JEL0829]|nr:hypothetical protein HDV03_005122 [Kappamyces sp. JEL0829]